MEHDHLRLVAAKAIIKNDSGKVLVLQQSDEATVSGAGKWHMPGGIVERGESPTDAVVRETKEEANLDVTVVRLLDAAEWQADIRGEHFDFVGLFYECALSIGAVTVDQSEATTFTWIGREDIDSITVLEPARTILLRALQNKY